MVTQTKHILTPATLKTEGDDEGSLEAVISTFDLVDRGGDIVLASAFTDGQEVMMVWSHDWNEWIGKGRIAVEPGRAVFKGQLWLDDPEGLKAYGRIKKAGSLAQYSWGFQILDADFAERDGQSVRVIKRTEVFEASPVLIGEGMHTGTLSLKSGLSFRDQMKAVQATAIDGRERAESLADLRLKEGRILSETNRQLIAETADTLAEQERRLRGLHAATAPKDDGKAARELRGAALRQIAAIHLIAS